jgi:hypothetical protein
MDLPIGIYTNIIEFMEYKDIIKLLRTCLFMNDIINNDILNKNILGKAKRKYDHFNRIKELRNVYYGRVDKDIDDFSNGIKNAVLWDKKNDQYKNKENLKPIFIKTKILIFNGLRTTLSQLNIDNTYNIYKNLKCTNINCIESIKLTIGGCRVDKIYTNIIDVLQHLYQIDDKTIIPFDFCKNNNFIKQPSYQEVGIIVEMKNGYSVNDFNMTIDIHELNNLDKEFYINNNNHLSIISVTDNKNFQTFEKYAQITLPFHLPTSYLILDCNKIKIKLLNIYFNDIDSGITLEDTYMYNEKYILPFTPSLNKINKYSINMARISETILHITFEDKNENENEIFQCNIQSVCHNVMINLSGVKYSH